MSAFVEWIQCIREQLVVNSQSQFGEMLGQSPRYIYVLEKGATTIRIDALEPLMQLIGIDFKEQKLYYDNAVKIALSTKKGLNLSFHEFIGKRYDIIDHKDKDDTFFKEDELFRDIDADLMEYLRRLPYYGSEYKYGSNKIVDMQGLDYFWFIVAVEYFTPIDIDIICFKTRITVIILDIICSLKDLCLLINSVENDQAIRQRILDSFESISNEIPPVENNSKNKKNEKRTLEYIAKQRTIYIYAQIMLDYNTAINNLYQYLRTEGKPSLSKFTELVDIFIKLGNEVKINNIPTSNTLYDLSKIVFNNEKAIELLNNLSNV